MEYINEKKELYEILLQYIEENGILSFFDWYDESSWYPQGRFIGETTFPGLMIISYLFQQALSFFHIYINLSTVCIYIGPFSSILIPIFFYHLCQILIGKRSVSLLAGFFSSICVILVSCSFVGYFDNQSISITLILINLYLFFRSILNSNSYEAKYKQKTFDYLNYIILLSLSYGILSITSGEYIYIANLFALISCFSIFFGFFTINLYFTYSIWFIIGTIISSSLPYIGDKVFYSMVHLFPNLTFIFIQFYMIFYFLQKCSKISAETIHSILLIFVVLIVLFIILIIKFTQADYFLLLGRIIYIIFPFLSAKEKSFFYSVEEQNPTSWSMFFVSLGPLLYLLPIGFYILLKKQMKGDKGSFYIICMTIPTLYFATTMMRLLLIFSIDYIIIASIVIDTFLRRSFRSLFKAKSKNVSFFDSCLAILLIFCFCLMHIYHSIFFTFNPSYESTLNRQIEVNLDGNKTEIVDSTDFNEALMWIKNNIPKISKIMALWPHGYQISSYTKRTVFCDGNTNNLTHMNLIHLFFASNELDAWKIAKYLDVNYVVVIFGGASGLKTDDLYFSYSFLKSLEIEYKNIRISDYFNSPYLSSENPTDAAKNSMIFKLSYYNFINWSLNENLQKGFDISKGFKVGALDFDLKLFNEVFTSKNWIFRIFSVSFDFVL